MDCSVDRGACGLERHTRPWTRPLAIHDAGVFVPLEISQHSIKSAPLVSSVHFYRKVQM